MVEPSEVGPGGSVDYVAIGKFRVSPARQHAAAAWNSYAPHVLKKRFDTISNRSKCSVVGSRTDSLNAHQDMHEEPDLVHRVVIRAALPCVEREWWNRADIRELLPHTARCRCHERTISPHGAIYPGESLIGLTHRHQSIQDRHSATAVEAHPGSYSG